MYKKPQPIKDCEHKVDHISMDTGNKYFAVGLGGICG